MDVSQILQFLFWAPLTKASGQVENWRKDRKSLYGQIVKCEKTKSSDEDKQT